ncbi:hypothetical protein ACFWNN_22255 [Lentzea sp. NPDC058450]|uniref:hypothetical protein n=1 Tax=Lentzea sp. NPDC058450 TaxID=3346505 RepID=UPI003648BCFE
MTEPREQLLALLVRYTGDPRRLHDEIVALDPDVRGIETTAFGGRFEPMAPLLDAARWLISRGTDDRLRLLGLKLLDGAAEPGDVQDIVSLARAPALSRFAVRVLLRVPGAERTAIQLAEDAGERHLVIRPLITHPDPWIADWVRAHCGDGSVARRVAEAHDLLALLDQFDVPDRLWDQAGRLLHGMSRTHGYSVLHEYPDAVAACRRWVALAHLRPPTPERLVALTAFADEVATGYAALVLGDQRVDLVAAMKEVASAWIEELGPADPWAALRVAALDVPPSGFAVRVVTSPPGPVSAAEARVVIDGVPIAARVFGCWRADSPEQLIPRLAATAEPREIVLDENDNEELRVTIVREGDEVAWRDWKCLFDRRLPGDFRFDAAAYDREVARVTNDHSWEWPARTVARLVTERLRADPSILGRWECGDGFCWSTFESPDLAEFRFADAHGRYRLGIDVAGREPEVVADEVIAGLATDPRK